VVDQGWSSASVYSVDSPHHATLMTYSLSHVLLVALAGTSDSQTDITLGL